MKILQFDPRQKATHSLQMRLTLTNFRHHRNYEIELPSQGVVLFSGPSGSGKSTVLTALEWLFYGKQRKISSFDQKKTTVSLVYDGIALQNFRDANGEHPPSLTVIRKRDPALLQLICGAATYEGEEAQAIVNQVFGCEAVFLSSSYLKQGERSTLLDGKNADKMAVVEQFTFSNENIARYKEIIMRALRDTEKALDVANGGTNVLEAQLESFRVLNERQLEQLASERSRRGTEMSAVVLDRELGELATTIEELWRRKNELEVQERARAAIVAINAGIDVKLAPLRRQLAACACAVEPDKEQLPALEAQLILTRSTIEAARDRKSLLDGEERSRREVLAANESAQEAILALEAQQLSTFPSVTEAQVEALVQELARALLFEEYQTLRVQAAQRRAEFTRLHGTERPLVDSQQAGSDSEEAVRAELAQLTHLQVEYRRAVDNNERLEAQLHEYPPITKATTLTLKSELNFLHVREQVYELEVRLEPQLATRARYPLDAAIVREVRSAATIWVRALQAVTVSLRELGLADEPQLDEKLRTVQDKLARCGAKVKCPSCNTELIYANEVLLPVSAKKSKPLPARIGSRAPTSPVASTVPTSPAAPACNENAQELQAEVALLLRVKQQYLALRDAPEYFGYYDLGEAEAELRELEALEKSLIDFEQLAKLHVALEQAPRARSQVKIEAELTALERRGELAAQMKEVIPIDIERLDVLVATLKQFEQKRGLFERLTLFERQEEREAEAWRERSGKLRKLYPEQEECALRLLDEQELEQYRDSDTVQAELQQYRSYYTQQQQQSGLRARIEALRATLRAIPESRGDEVAAVTTELAALQSSLASDEAELVALRRQFDAARVYNELVRDIEACSNSKQELPSSVVAETKGVEVALEKEKRLLEQRTALRNCLSLSLQLRELETNLETHRVTTKEETKKYALFDKLKLKALEAESLALESTVAAINREMAEQLESLFTDPITVRFETVKTLSSGQSKHCINLVVNYRGVEYDDIRQLSGGEAARVSLAITLALNKTANAPFLLLDESLSALDAELVDTVIDSLKIVATRYVIPIFVVLHNSVEGFFDEVVTFGA